MRSIYSKIMFLILLSGQLYAKVILNDKNSTVAVKTKATLKVVTKLVTSQGTIATDKNAKLEGVNYQLNDTAIVQEDGIDARVTAAYNPVAKSLTVANQKVTAQPGQVEQSISLSGPNCTLEGIPSNFTKATGVTLASAATTVSMALSSPLSTSVGMAGGTIAATTRLEFSAGAQPVGSGTIDFGGQSIIFDAVPRTLGDTLTLKKAADLQFFGTMTVTGELVFDGDGFINGHGAILDISQGGTIRIRPRTSLSMTDLKLKGLGLGSIVFTDTSAQLRLSNVEIEMNRNYTVTIGGIVAEGPSNVVVKDKILRFEQRGSMTVDGIGMTYDTTTFTDMQNIRPLRTVDPSGQFIGYQNDGTIYRKNTLDTIISVSNALLALSKNNSNTLLFLAKNNSNALLFGDRNNSNTLLYLNRNNSNALLFGDRNNSNTLLYLNRNNSNALLFGDRNNSNTLLYLNRNNSNALLFGDRNNSNTLLYLNRNNSNALLFGDRNNSNTLLYLNRNNSNALLFGDRNNSNTLLYLNRNNSNTLLFLTKNNSNAIVWLDEQLQTIDHGPDHIIINGPTYDQRFDIYLSSTHLMFINNSVAYDGHGHTIHFANGCDNDDILHIAAAATVTFTNVIFNNYRDQAFDLGAAANITFGNCTRLVLAETQVRDMPWVFQGETQVRGHANRVELDPSGQIIVRPSSMLTLQDTALVGLKTDNIRCDDSSSIVRLSQSNLYLASDFSFTSGSLEFYQNNTISGTSIFTYASVAPSTITPGAQLTLQGIGFTYAPIVADRDLLVLADKTATLFLDGCSMNSTTTGMRLMRGQLLVDQRNNLMNTGAVSLSEGFAFGDGTPANDLTVQVKPGASLNVIDGILDYQNVD